MSDEDNKLLIGNSAARKEVVGLVAEWMLLLRAALQEALNAVDWPKEVSADPQARLPLVTQIAHAACERLFLLPRPTWLDQTTLALVLGWLPQPEHFVGAVLPAIRPVLIEHGAEGDAKEVILQDWPEGTLIDKVLCSSAVLQPLKGLKPIRCVRLSIHVGLVNGPMEYAWGPLRHDGSVQLSPPWSRFPPEARDLSTAERGRKPRLIH
jgi:hypothetical protein